MSEGNKTSLAVWDVPMPAVAGGRFAIKAGAKAASGRPLAGSRVEVTDAAGHVVASGTLGDTPWSGTEALYWTSLDVPAPATPGIAEYSVRLPGGEDHGAAAARFSVATAGRPDCTLRVIVTERDSAEALAGVEVRLGPFHGRTDREGCAEIRICKGVYRLQLWRTAHIAEPKPVTIDGDLSLALTMVHVPEEHPDARWVR